ncbi:acyl-CoA dehydrogenase family protein [Thermodesulfobacteriota bacterium]
MIDFELPEEHKILLETVRRFATEEIKPLAEKFDRSPTFLRDDFLHIYKRMSDLGFFGVMVPEEYGGIGDGFDVLGCSIIHEELARASAGIALSYLPMIIVGGAIINKFGTKEQKAKYLPPAVKGEVIPCLGVTEPDAGSDVAGIKTTFFRDGNDYVINGTKQFITNAPVGNLFYTLAKEKGTGKHYGFLVEAGNGVSVGKELDKMGFRSSPTSEIFYEDCRVPEENIVGKEGEGVMQSLIGIELERIFCSSINLGIAEAALEESIKYAKERMAFGKPIAEFQMVQSLLANMAVGVETGKSMLYYAIWDFHKSKDVKKKFPSLATSTVKYHTGNMVLQVTSDAVQIHGGYGYIKEYPVERYMRDAKLLQIGGGTSQIQQIMIARNILS